MQHPVIMLVGYENSKSVEELPFFVNAMKVDSRVTELFKQFVSPPEGRTIERIVDEVRVLLAYDCQQCGNVGYIYIADNEDELWPLAEKLEALFECKVSSGSPKDLHRVIIDYVAEYQMTRDPVAVTAAIREAQSRGGTYYMGRERFRDSLIEHYIETPDALDFSIALMQKEVMAKKFILDPYMVDIKSVIEDPQGHLNVGVLLALAKRLAQFEERLDTRRALIERTFNKVNGVLATPNPKHVEIHIASGDVSVYKRVSRLFEKEPELYISHDMLTLLEAVLTHVKHLSYEYNNTSSFTIANKDEGGVGKTISVFRPMLNDKPERESIGTRLLAEIINLLP